MTHLASDLAITRLVVMVRLNKCLATGQDRYDEMVRCDVVKCDKMCGGCEVECVTKHEVKCEM